MPPLLAHRDGDGRGDDDGDHLLHLFIQTTSLMDRHCRDQSRIYCYEWSHT